MSAFEYDETRLGFRDERNHKSVDFQEKKPDVFKPLQLVVWNYS